MAAIDKIRNSIIEKLLTISNKDYLEALNYLIDKRDTGNETVKLTREQKLMLQISEDDIKNGKLVSEEELNKKDLKWLKEQ